MTFDTVSRPLNLEENLRDGVVDLAIDWLTVESNPFINRRIFDDHLVLLARRGHPTVDAEVTINDLRNAEFVTLRRRREIGHVPQALREVSELIIHDVMRVSELLEIPTVVASTDLLGIFASSMGSLMETRLGLKVLPIPLELPAVPIYMIWHETRRHDSGHSWLREIAAAELGRLGNVEHAAQPPGP